jgi:hypothetical protein
MPRSARARGPEKACRRGHTRALAAFAAHNSDTTSQTHLGHDRHEPGGRFCAPERRAHLVAQQAVARVEQQLLRIVGHAVRLELDENFEVRHARDELVLLLARLELVHLARGAWRRRGAREDVVGAAAGARPREDTAPRVRARVREHARGRQRWK